jgi:hypothetical protein
MTTTTKYRLPLENLFAPADQTCWTRAKRLFQNEDENLIAPIVVGTRRAQSLPYENDEGDRFNPRGKPYVRNNVRIYI